MNKLVFPPTTTPNGYQIGKFICDCPTFYADDDYRTLMISNLMPEYGMLRRRAEAEADKRIDELGRSAFINSMRDYVRRLADTYAKRFPHKINGKTLDGFDPEYASKFYMPRRYTKGRTDPRLDQLLIKMANERKTA